MMMDGMCEALRRLLDANGRYENLTTRAMQAEARGEYGYARYLEEERALAAELVARAEGSIESLIAYDVAHDADVLLVHRALDAARAAHREE